MDSHCFSKDHLDQPICLIEITTQRFYLSPTKVSNNKTSVKKKTQTKIGVQKLESLDLEKLENNTEGINIDDA